MQKNEKKLENVVEAEVKYVGYHSFKNELKYGLLSVPTQTSAEFKLYWRRWLILLLFCLFSFSNAMLWISFAPIVKKVQTFYQVNVSWINALSLVYMIIYIPTSFLASYAIFRNGVKWGLILGGTLNAAGAWIRSAGSFPDHPELSFAFLFIGQCVAASAQAFVLSIPPRLASDWFGPSERATATSIGALFNQLGVAFGYIIPPYIVSEPSDMPRYLMIEAGISTVVGIGLLFYQNKPPTPPSYSSEDAKPEFASSVIHCLKMPSFIFLTVSYGIAIGVFYAASTLLDQILHDKGYSEIETGWFGMFMVLAGVAGAIIVGFVSDRLPGKLKWITFVSYIGTVICTAWFTWATSIAYNFPMMAVASSLVGFFITAVLAVSLEFAVEICFPMQEDMSAGILFVAAQIFGIIFTVGTDGLGKVIPLSTACWVWVGSLALGNVCLFLVKASYARLNQEVANIDHESQLDKEKN